MPPETARANRLWADLLVEELVRSGVDFFCVAPGSRSTPLVAALASNRKADSLVHFDERGTAFAALGYARATGRPAAWITTSGTAVANGLPAVVEAATDGVPMLLLTADRPPELRQTGANQTIDQPDIFGGYARWRFDLPAPDLEIDPAVVLTTVDQAVYRAQRSPKGPVHLNLMFREPFLPNPESEGDSDSGPVSWLGSGEPYTRYAPTKLTVNEGEIEHLWEALRPVKRGLVVAGRLESQAQGKAVARFAEALGWPLLPDISSQMRLGGDSGVTAPYYDALLADDEFRERYEPEAVVHFGGRALSKRLEQYLAHARPSPYVVVRENPFRLDPGHQVTRSVETDIVGFCDAIAGVAAEHTADEAGPWLGSWIEASRKVGEYLDDVSGEAEELREPLVARLISRHIPAGDGLVLASSMPIRDADTFAAHDGPAVSVIANRGASGIDGTVATAAGVARGLGVSVTLLIGDLALLHDLNSLAMLRDLKVVVVVINNDGGGIFSFLPIAGQRKFFEPYFGTPQDVSFEPAASMFGLDYELPETLPDFVDAYRAACSRDTSTVIEIGTDRRENVSLHQELLEGMPDHS